MKKTYLFIYLLACFGTYSYAQSELISATPKDGVGNQIVNIHSYSGSTSVNNGAFNLLYNHSDGAGSSKHWANNNQWYPWVVFELIDNYDIDKIIFRDAKTQSAENANVPEYHISVSSENPDNCQWQSILHVDGQENVNVKEINLNAQNVRYIKFVGKRGQKTDGTWDNLIRIYGLDIYGTLSEKVERESVSVGKTVLGFNGESYYYERPLHILDGNTTTEDNVWRSTRPTVTDSLRWVVLDLETDYNITGFKLHDAKTLTPNAANITGYNVYVSTIAPDIDKITPNIDQNTQWTKVVDAYAQDRIDQNIKTDEIATTKARYVKLEIPRSRANGYIRVFQFEVLGKEAPSSLNDNKLNELNIYPTQVKRGENILVKSEKGGLLKIINTQGQIIFEYLLQSGEQNVQTQNLIPGLYILNLNNANSKIIVK